MSQRTSLLALPCNATALRSLAVGLASLAACWPFLHFVSWIGDEGILMRGSVELLRGRVMYRDFFEFYPPAPFLLTAGWLAVFGETVISMRALSTALVVGIAILTFLVAKKASQDSPLSAATAVVWAIAAQGGSASVSHHLFTTVWSMAAMLASLSGRPGVAGLFCAAAGMTTQTRGALAAAASTIWLRPPEAWQFLIGLTVVPTICLIYLVGTGTFEAFFADALVWPATRYSGVQWTPLGAHPSDRNWPFVAIHPLALFLGCLAVLRRRTIVREPTFRRCVAFALAGLAGSFPRPDSAHLLVTAPLVVPLALLCWKDLTADWALRYKACAAALGAVVLIQVTVALALFAYVWGWAPRQRTPAGPATFAEAGAGDLSMRVGQVPARDGVFFYPYMPLMSFLSGREHVGIADVFVPGYTSPSQYADACREVAARARWIARDNLWIDPSFLKDAFPHAGNLSPQAKVALERSIERGFEIVWSSGRFDLLRRRPGTSVKCS